MPVERANFGPSRGGRGQNNNRGRGQGHRGRSGHGGARGRASRGRVSRGRVSRGRGGSSNVPYVTPTYPPQFTLYFRSASEPDLVAKLNQPGVKRVTFGADFDITDAHLEVMASIPALLTTLEVLSLGDSDTGNGAQLTDAAVQSFVSQTPNLVSLSLDACTRLSNATLIHALEHCPRLQHLQITGNDKVKGGVTDLALKLLREREDLGVNLKELVLYDQRLGHKAIQDLTKAKKGLIAREGETLGDGIAANMLAAIDGGAMTTAWKDGKRIGFDVDTGFFGHGGFDYDMPFERTIALFFWS